MITFWLYAVHSLSLWRPHGRQAGSDGNPAAFLLLLCGGRKRRGGTENWRTSLEELKRSADCNAKRVSLEGFGVNRSGNRRVRWSGDDNTSFHRIIVKSWTRKNDFFNCKLNVWYSYKMRLLKTDVSSCDVWQKPPFHHRNSDQEPLEGVWRRFRSLLGRLYCPEVR